MSGLAPILPIPGNNPQWQKLMEDAHDEGLRILADRMQRNDHRPLGVHRWTSSMRERGCYFEESDIRRRINWLAKREYWQTAPWLHLPVRFRDDKPSSHFRMNVEPQSAYVVNPFFAPEFEEFVLKATGKRDVMELIDWVRAESPPVEVV